jgi:hypothetical protein
MFLNSPRRNRVSKQSACALAIMVAGLTVSAKLKAGDDHRCQFIDGPFRSVTVPPPACTSPVGLCTHGQLSGELVAAYDFTFATIQSAGDPNDPTESVYTGHSVVTTAHGVLLTNDSGVIHIPADGSPSPFVTTATVASGSGRLTGTTGVFVASGNLDFGTGVAVGSYIAQLCRSGHDD